MLFQLLLMFSEPVVHCILHFVHVLPDISALCVLHESNILHYHYACTFHIGIVVLLYVLSASYC